MSQSLATLCTAFLGCTNAYAAAPASDFPPKSIRVIVPQSAGGSTDLAARVVTQKLGESLGQTLVIDNRPGAGSLNGTETVAKAAPDGYTLLCVAASFTINPSLHEKLPFDPIRDFVPITRLAALPHILVVHPTLPVKSVKELIALAKAKPGELNYASSGIATSTHLAAELFRHMTGTDMVQVPFKGGAPGHGGAAERTGAALFRDDLHRAAAREERQGEGAGGDEREAVDRRTRISRRSRKRAFPATSTRRGSACSPRRKRPLRSSSKLHAESLKAVNLQDVKGASAARRPRTRRRHAPGIRRGRESRSREVEEGRQGGGNQAAVRQRSYAARVSS